MQQKENEQLCYVFKNTVSNIPLSWVCKWTSCMGGSFPAESVGCTGQEMSRISGKLHLLCYRGTKLQKESPRGSNTRKKTHQKKYQEQKKKRVKGMNLTRMWKSEPGVALRQHEQIMTLQVLIFIVTVS